MVLFRDTGAALLAGTIVETEAYGGPEDRASHARAGRTQRTEPMFGPPGHAYVYLVYGMHWCLNVVTETDGSAGAVLIRALSPTVGLSSIRKHRGRMSDPDTRLAAGPARLCDALDIDRRQNGLDLTSGPPLWLARPDGGERAKHVVAGPRVGVAYAGDEWSRRPWRFGLRDHPALSRPFSRVAGDRISPDALTGDSQSAGREDRG